MLGQVRTPKFGDLSLPRDPTARHCLLSARGLGTGVGPKGDHHTLAWTPVLAPFTWSWGQVCVPSCAALTLGH